MNKSLLFTPFLFLLFLFSSCAGIINLGNQKTDSYCLAFPASEGSLNNYQDVIGYCYRADGDSWDNMNYLPIDSAMGLPFLLKASVYSEDRENNGATVLFQVYSSNNATEANTLNYAYVVPSEFPSQYLPQGMSIDQLKETLSTLQTEDSGHVSLAEAQALWQKLKEANYPYCGTISLTNNLALTHSQIFGE